MRYISVLINIGRDGRTHDRIVDLDQDARVFSRISTGDRDCVLRSSSRRASNLQLCAPDIKLCSAFGRGSMQTDVLAAEEIFARGDFGRQGEVPRGGILGGPVHAGAVDVRRGFVDLEPVTAAIIGGKVIAGRLGQVDRERTWVAQLIVDFEAELVIMLVMPVSTGKFGPYLIPSSNSLSLGPRPGAVGRSDIASQVGAGDVRDRAVGASNCTDILIGACDIAIDNERLEVVLLESQQNVKISREILKWEG